MIEHRIIGILKSKTEDNEMTQGDVISYVPDWEFKEVAQEIVKLFSMHFVIKAEGDSVCLLNRVWHQCDTHNGSHEGCGNCKHFKQTDL